MFLIVVIALTLGAIGVTWWLAQSTGQQGGLAATQRFTARPGTTREKAVALTSSKRPSGVDEFTTDPASLGKNAPPRVRSLSQEDGPEETATVERLVREALEEARPRDGIRKLEELLQEALYPDAAWRLHLGLAALYGRLEPPETDAAARAFAAARAAARATETQWQIGMEEAAALARAGRSDTARACLESALDQMPPRDASLAPGALHLIVRMGDMLAESGHAGAAERAYEQAVDRALIARDGAAEDLADALRLAATRLTLALRAAGRHEDADALGRRVELRLRALARAGG
ncbi:MAG TPA: hypothetical protein PKI11_09745 [Candidatus Hydrogenedentes bacterium]|nr:hypothetical protein [Candidatus Hydrogenedentota bacterium]